MSKIFKNIWFWALIFLSVIFWIWYFYQSQKSDILTKGTGKEIVEIISLTASILASLATILCSIFIYIKENRQRKTS